MKKSTQPLNTPNPYLYQNGVRQLSSPSTGCYGFPNGGFPRFLFDAINVDFGLARFAKEKSSDLDPRDVLRLNFSQDFPEIRV